MNHIKAFFILILLVSITTSCAPQSATNITPTQPESTQTSIPPTATLTFTPLPTETSLPTDTPSPTPPSCAMPLNPVDNASVPARGAFDFTWTAFAGATSYIVSIGPKDWYPTNFPVSGTTLTRYMETFPSSPSYEWSIIALNASGQQICTAGPYKFVTSKDMYTTPSFSGNNNSGTSSTDNSSNTQPDGTSSTSYTSPNEPVLGDSYILSGDSDQDCQLGVFLQVRTNRKITSLKLLYGYSSDALDNSVDFTTVTLEPYPAYTNWNAGTPRLSAKNGDVVYFTYWIKTVDGDKETESRGPVFTHTMAYCNP